MPAESRANSETERTASSRKRTTPGPKSHRVTQHGIPGKASKNLIEFTEPVHEPVHQFTRELEGLALTLGGINK